MALELGLIVGISALMRESETMRTTFMALAGEPLLAVLTAALLTWLAHASLAALHLPLLGRWVALGNALFKLTGILLLQPFLGEVTLYDPWIETKPVCQIVIFHTVFNLGLAVIFIVFTGVVGR